MHCEKEVTAFTSRVCVAFLNPWILLPTRARLAGLVPEAPYHLCPPSGLPVLSCFCCGCKESTHSAFIQLFPDTSVCGVLPGTGRQGHTRQGPCSQKSPAWRASQTREEANLCAGMRGQGDRVDPAQLSTGGLGSHPTARWLYGLGQVPSMCLFPRD